MSVGLVRAVRADFLAAFAGATLWCVTLVATPSLLVQLVLPLRIAALCFVAYALRGVFLREPRHLLLSPPLHMSGLLIAFYSLVPMLSSWVIGDQRHVNSNLMIMDYPGSPAEGLILGLACLCAAAHFAVAMLIRARGREELYTVRRFPPALGWPALAVLAAIATAGILTFRIFDDGWLRVSAPGREFWSAAPAVVAFCAACIIYVWCKAPRDRLLLGIIGIAAALGTLLLSNQAPLPLLIAYSMGLLYAAQTKVSLRHLTLAALFAAILAPAILIAAFFVLRPSYLSIPQDLDGREISSGSAGVVQRVFVVAEAKFLRRQAISAGCYQRIAERSLSDERSGDPFYFAVAIVPKLLWPDKPNLSRGSEFAELCGIDGAVASGHSESITIIGEPILEDGLRGLVVAELTLVALLSAAAYLGLTGGPLRVICLTALLPWLLAVEQHFAMYVGNVFKMALVVLPLALLVHWVMRRGHRGDLVIPSGGNGTGADLRSMMGDGVAR